MDEWSKILADLGLSPAPDGQRQSSKSPGPQSQADPASSSKDSDSQSAHSSYHGINFIHRGKGSFHLHVPPSFQAKEQSEERAKSASPPPNKPRIIELDDSDPEPAIKLIPRSPKQPRSPKLAKAPQVASAPNSDAKNKLRLAAGLYETNEYLPRRHVEVEVEERTPRRYSTLEGRAPRRYSTLEERAPRRYSTLEERAPRRDHDPVELEKAEALMELQLLAREGNKLKVVSALNEFLLGGKGLCPHQQAFLGSLLEREENATACIPVNLRALDLCIEQMTFLLRDKNRHGDCRHATFRCAGYNDYVRKRKVIGAHLKPRTRQKVGLEPVRALVYGRK